jgi:hypothetical protein
MGSGGGGEVDPKRVQVLGRVPVARTVRLDAIGPAAPAAAAPAPRSADVLCHRCGASVCDGARRALFAGMVLRCGCGEKTLVQRAP